MKKYLLSLLLLVSFSSLQSQSVEYYREYNGTIGTNYYTRAMICDTTVDGKYLVVGRTNGNSGSNYLYAVLEQNGDVYWQKDSAVYDNLFNHEATFYNGRRTLDNGFIFVGTLVDFANNTESAIFILKTDESGNEQWRKIIEPSRSGYAMDISLNSDSSFFLTGNIRDINAINDNNFLLKLSSQGDSLYLHEYSAIRGSASNLFKIGNQFFITGATSRLDSLTQRNATGFYFISCDSVGNYLSNHSVFESMLSINPRSFWKTNDNSFLLSCSITDTASNGVVQLLKVGRTASIIWRETIVNSPNYGSFGCELPNGNILVVYGNNQIRELDSFGDTIWTRNFADTSYHGFGSISSVSIFPVNNSTFLVSGGVNVSAPGGSWPYLTKISDSTLTDIIEIEKDLFSIYPNPTKNSFTVKNMSENSKSSMKIFNILGEIVFEEQLIGKTEYIVDVKFSKGIYFVWISSEEMNAVKKLLVN